MPHILGEKKQQEEPTMDKETSDEQKTREGMQAKIETLTRQL